MQKENDAQKIYHVRKTDIDLMQTKHALPADFEVSLPPERKAEVSKLKWKAQ